MGPFLAWRQFTLANGWRCASACRKGYLKTRILAPIRTKAIERRNRSDSKRCSIGMPLIAAAAFVPGTSTMTITPESLEGTAKKQTIFAAGRFRSESHGNEYHSFAPSRIRSPWKAGLLLLIWGTAQPALTEPCHIGPHALDQWPEEWQRPRASLPPKDLLPSSVHL
jgi:hypothetical protein